MAYRSFGERERAAAELSDVQTIARDARRRVLRVRAFVAAAIACSFAVAAFVGARLRTLRVATEQCHSVTVIVEHGTTESEPRTSRVCRTVRKSVWGSLY